jgi:23S rRNA (adenine2503-C2)-methyltransferase
MNKQIITELSHEELISALKEMKQPAFRANQIHDWIYKKNAASWDDMTNLSKELRQQCSEKWLFNSIQMAESVKSDDGTEKLLLKLHDGEFIEMVIIPADARITFCLSTQVGCPVGCLFCASGRNGLVRNLAMHEIIEEFQAGCAVIGRIPDNIVFMGIGEGLLNYENLIKAVERLTEEKYFAMGVRRITISTSGFVPGMLKLADYGKELNLAISLHAPNDEIRQKIIPGKIRYPISEIMEAADIYREKCNRMVTLEYTLLKDINDSAACAKALSRIAREHHTKINLIPYNDTGSEFKRPSTKTINTFEQILRNADVAVSVRRERGSDQAGACGQLRTEHMN